MFGNRDDFDFSGGAGPFRAISHLGLIRNQQQTGKKQDAGGERIQSNSQLQPPHEDRTGGMFSIPLYSTGQGPQV